MKPHSLSLQLLLNCVQFLERNLNINQKQKELKFHANHRENYCLLDSSLVVQEVQLFHTQWTVEAVEGDGRCWISFKKTFQC